MRQFPLWLCILSVVLPLSQHRKATWHQDSRPASESAPRTTHATAEPEDQR